MKHKIFFSILTALLFFAQSASAALLVPKGTPLQPIPIDNAPNYSQNINSEESIYSKNQNQNLEQISPEPSPDTGSAEANPVAVPAATTAPSTEPIWLYWILLIVGSIGLIAALTWVYWRFRK